VIFSVMVALAALLGILFVLPIGGADMPVVVSLLNSYAGLAAVATGFAINNNILIIVGALDGLSGLILAIAMSRAMNRSFANVLFGAFGSTDAATAAAAAAEGEMSRTTAEDAALTSGMRLTRQSRDLDVSMSRLTMQLRKVKWEP